MADVINFEKRRQSNIEKKKRSFERVFFSEFLGSYAQLDDAGTKYDVELVDVSHDGCMFQIPYSKDSFKHFDTDKDVTLRVYFTKDHFLPLSVQVKHKNEYIDDKGRAHIRFGGEFDKSLPSFAAFEPFIDFIYKFAEFSSTDKGEPQVYFL